MTSRKWKECFHRGDFLNNRQFYICWQLLLPGYGRRIWEIIDFFGSPRQAWEASEKDLSQISFLGSQGAQRLIRQRENINYEHIIQHCENIGCSIVTMVDESYPPLLKAIYDPPPALFVRGRLPREKAAVAVVGSRRPTPYGLAASEAMAGELAMAGLVIVSGMARGIDSAAHRGALKVKGDTVAVLGCGPDIVYPRENGCLMKQIIDQGAVVTEFPPGSPPVGWHFPSRNRIISGLSAAVLVVEAAEKSGALITADLALEQGREVLAIPGNITSLQSSGTNTLIKEGARLVAGPLDVLEPLGLGELFIHPQPQDPPLAPEEKKVYTCLSYLPQSLEEIVAESHLKPQEAAAALTLLEVKGLIRIVQGKMYVRAGQPGLPMF
ncbi:DNA-processing protein DprA [Desulforamulus ruminis]|uniref:DNA protecting protein DprA n=1 Tax=Desulforamulus ruminis (strain ATCC 23193 / DSM 2154 / NCIMB 8452 / DL) TaxID=696281 RepID=F6DU48_DESRL|nr:DNA protecting protein DprA [Desulforamulus ruminis DSM 2154]